MPGKRKDRHTTEARDLTTITSQMTSAGINPCSKFWIFYEKREKQ
jgi:hypothetical protein